VPAPRPLSRDRILQAAFDHADEHGLAAVTMRSIAARLGVEAMSLYHHVPNKQAVLDGLVDLMVRVAELPAGPVTVEEWLRGTAAGLRQLARLHPRVVPLLATRALPLSDPRSARPFEAGLEAFTRAGYDLSGAYAAVQSTALAMLSMAQLEATYALTPSDSEEAYMTLPTEEFPLLTSLASQAAGLDEFWGTLVDALVKGLVRA
jgi:AcrR family transcriptional regulator